mmetsp:Transcript_64204/g.133935  ORF Transcript_64204/g.133935 Transcript_64204/m.133935 type:complete len:308 (-) Transcript_64204:11614-12537(-)
MATTAPTLKFRPPSTSGMGVGITRSSAAVVVTPAGTVFPPPLCPPPPLYGGVGDGSGVGGGVDVTVVGAGVLELVVGAAVVVVEVVLGTSTPSTENLVKCVTCAVISSPVAEPPTDSHSPVVSSSQCTSAACHFPSSAAEKLSVMLTGDSNTVPAGPNTAIPPRGVKADWAASVVGCDSYILIETARLWPAAIAPAGTTIPSPVSSAMVDSVSEDAMTCFEPSIVPWVLQSNPKNPGEQRQLLPMTVPKHVREQSDPKFDGLGHAGSVNWIFNRSVLTVRLSTEILEYPSTSRQPAHLTVTFTAALS